MPSEPSNSGIITDEASGERHIPSSTRADGSTRKAIRIRPGYRPPEDVEVYKNRTAEVFRNRGKGPIPGTEGLATGKDGSDNAASASASAAANKNAKRREARKKAKAAAAGQGGEAAEEAAGDDDEGAATDGKAAPAGEGAEAQGTRQADATAAAVAGADVEREKKARNLKKKLKQAKELKSKKEGGETLLPEQIAKVIKINELIRELDALGFDAEGEPKAKDGETTAEVAKDVKEKAPA